MPEPWMCPTLLGIYFLGGVLLLIGMEIWLLIKFDKEPVKFWPLALTHLPWVLGWMLPLVTQMTFPPPQDFLLRKIQVLFGAMWMSHLFLFTGWFLYKTRKNGLAVSRTFGAVAVFFFLGTTLWTTQCDLSGDEPHYLMMTYSLIHDGDLDLTNQYANKDYEKFYHRGVLTPQGLDHWINGKLYSYHPLGPALLALPGFALLGRMGAALTMAVLTALAFFLTLLILERVGARGLPLRAVGWVGLFSSPFLLFAGLIYPEVPTACLVSLSLLLFLEKRWNWLGFCLGLMLWMHNRNVLLVIPLLLLLSDEVRKEPGEKVLKISKMWAWFLVPTAVLALYFEWTYGVFTPLGAHHEPFTSLFPFARFFTGFFGLLLDQECGLWFHFPIFALAVTGAMLLYHSQNPLRRLTLGTFGFFFLFMSFYENLGLTPATRYMVGVTPLLLIMLYHAFEKITQWDIWAKLAVLSIAVGILMNGILSAVPWMRYNKLDGENMMLKLAGSAVGLPLTKWEPAFQAPVIEMKSYWISAFWVAAAIGFTLWFLKGHLAKGRKEKV